MAVMARGAARVVHVSTALIYMEISIDNQSKNKIFDFLKITLTIGWWWWPG
jgi:hypothetical protein